MAEEVRTEPDPQEMWRIIDEHGHRGNFPAEAFAQPMAEIVQKPWGFELIWAKTETYVGKAEHIKAGHRISMQYHAPNGDSPAKAETMFLMSGEVTLWMGTSPDNLVPVKMELGFGYYIPPFTLHRMEAHVDSVVIEAAQPETGDTVRIHDDYARGTETVEMRSQPNRGWNPKIT